MRKIKLISEDMLEAQKVLANQSQLFPEKEEIYSAKQMLLFNQWECKCGGKVISVENE